MANTDAATRYRKIRRLGAGGMATVTLAEDTVLGRPVALKRVHSGGESREMLRLKREALVGASLNHPEPGVRLRRTAPGRRRCRDRHGVRRGADTGRRDRLTRRPARHPRPCGCCAEWRPRSTRSTSAASSTATSSRPTSCSAHDGSVKLADLGVADVADRTRITTSGAVVGSFNYMAAEQLDGAAPSPAMDIYALAAVAYEMLAGERARPESNPLALAHAISTQPPPDLRRVWPAAPPATAAVLQRAHVGRPGPAARLGRRVRPPARVDVRARATDPRRAAGAGRGVARAEPAAATRAPCSCRPSSASPALAVAGVLVVAL